MDKVDLGFAFGLPPEKALAYFKSKGYVLSMDWQEVHQAAHAKAFTVAHVMKTDILQDLRGGVEQFLEGKATRRQYMRGMEKVLHQKGWWSTNGRGLVTDDAGEVLGKKLNPRRLETILHTNAAQAYNAAEYQRGQAIKHLKPYRRYDHHIHKIPRPAHVALDGLIFGQDDPFWDTHAPQNGFGCNCTTTFLSQRDIDREGMAGNMRSGAEHLSTWTREVKKRDGSIQKHQVTTYTDPKRRGDNGKPVRATPDVGWNYNVGKAAATPFTPPPLDTLPRTFDNGRVLGERPPLPKPAPVSATDVLPKGLSEEAYAQAFLNEFGATLDKGVVYQDVTGAAVQVNKQLFVDKQTGELKSSKFERGPYLKLLAQTIKNPDEVWLNWQEYNGSFYLKRRYIKAYEFVENGRTLMGMGVFELGKDGWSGSTLFAPNVTGSAAAQLKYIEKQRDGLLLYRIVDGQ
jgi:SPP1 gp7 family putative phage head morphogenesis protein